MKKTIRLTESELKSLISEAVANLNESAFEDKVLYIQVVGQIRFWTNKLKKIVKVSKSDYPDESLNERVMEFANLIENAIQEYKLTANDLGIDSRTIADYGSQNLEFF
jgi:hypothetical protein